MNIPITNPQLNLNDGSKNDDSIKQEGVTINASNGSVVNTNSGNGHGRLKSGLYLTIIFSGLLYLLAFGAVAFQVNSIGKDMRFEKNLQMEKIGQKVQHIETKVQNLDGKVQTLDKSVSALDTNIQDELKKAREGNIWLLRNDLLKSLDVFEAKGEITENVFHALQDEYKHYREIGGNYDVEERWDSFKFKIRSNEVKLKKLK